MTKYPKKAKLLMIAYTTLAALSVWYSFFSHGFPLAYFYDFLILTGFAGVTLFYPVRSARGQSTFFLCNIFVFAAILLLPLSWTVLLCIAIWVATLPKRFKSGDKFFWVPPLINCAQLIIISTITHEFLFFTGARESNDSLSVLLIVFSCFLYMFLQTLLVTVLISFYRNVPWKSLDNLHIDWLFSEISQPLFGVIISLLYRLHPSVMIIVGILLALLYRVLRGIQLIRAAELDPKTGIYNYRYFEEQLKSEVSRAQSLRRPLSLIFVDLDYLRDINNEYGHQAGDVAIQEIAKILQRFSGGNGTAARFGGEEYVVLLPGTDVQEATYIAGQIRREIENAVIKLPEGNTISITASIGVAGIGEGISTPEELVKAADDALYKAKGSGRNMVCVNNRGTLEIADAAEGYVYTRMEGVDRGGVGAMNASAARPTPACASERKQAGTETAGTVKQKEGADGFTGADASKKTTQAQSGKAESPSTAPVSEEIPSVAHPGARLLTIAITFVSIPVLAWSLMSLQLQTDWPMLAVFLALAFLVQHKLKMNIYAKDGEPRSFSPSMAVTMAAGTYLGIAEAVAVNLISASVQVLSMKRLNTKTVVNICMSVVSAACGALPIQLLKLYSSEYQVWGPLAVLLGSALYYFMNVGIMAFYISLDTRTNVVRVWKQGMAWFTPYYAALTVSGGFLGYFYIVFGWIGTLSLLALQLLIYITFQRQVANMNEAMKAMETARDLLAAANRAERKNMQELTLAVSAIIDTRDANVFGHSRQVARYAVAVAKELGIADSDELEEIYTSALLHDLGKIGIPEAILHKPDKLTAEEYEIVKKHSALGEQILEGIEAFSRVATLVGHHHERWDGLGYPRGTPGVDIPLGARIISVADALDSILSDRPYSKAKPLSYALSELERCAGSQFDPSVVEAVQRLSFKMPANFFKNSYKGSESKLEAVIKDIIATIESSRKQKTNIS